MIGIPFRAVVPPRRYCLAWMLALCHVVAAWTAPQSAVKTAPNAKKHATAAKEDPLAPLLRQATEAIDKENFTAALDPLQKYIAERAEDPYAHFQLGYAYAGLKRAQDAKLEFSRAIALDPKMGAAYLNLGLVLMDSDAAAAARAFRHAAELQPSESRPLFLAGFALEHAGDLKLAEEQYRAALALAPNDYEYNFALGRAQLRDGQSIEAETYFRKAIEARGDSAPARLGLANTLIAQQKHAPAIDALADYLKLNPADHAAHFDRASSLMELKRYDEALGELDLAEKDTPPTPDELKMRGNIYVQQQNWKDAAIVLAQGVQAAPHDADMPTWLGHAEIELREYPAAIKILAQAYADHPQSPDPLRYLINAFYLNEDYPATIGAMDRLAKLETPKPFSWFVRAICYDKLGHKAEAVSAYQNFLDQDHGEHDAESFQSRRRMVALQHELGQIPKGRK
jgi:Flp pilus assembly protein TadD